MEITLSEVREALMERDTIAFSDLYTIKCVKDAIDAHVEQHSEGILNAAKNDEEFILGAIKNAKDDVIGKSDRIKGMVEAGVSDTLKKISDVKDSVTEVAKANGIELSKTQVLFIRDGITGEETEADVLEKCKSTAALSDLNDKDFTLQKGSDKKDAVIAQSDSGSSVEIVDPEEKREL